MHRRVKLVVLGLLLIQFGTGCYRWRNYRMNRIAERGHMAMPSVSSGPSCACDSSPLSGVSFGTPIAAPLPSVVAPPTLGVPSSVEPPEKMPTLSSRPIVGPVGLRR
jgi:hypothetical protein